MAEENHEDKNADCTNVQPGKWYQIDLIVHKISTFLGPTDSCCFRLVCKKWKKESSSIWEYHRIRHILTRASVLATKFLDEAFRTSVYYTVRAKLQPPDPLTVFSEYPPKTDCDFDSVGAEQLRDYFLNAKADDTVKKDMSFLVIKLKNWNRFGNFRSGQQAGAKWFINEIVDKVRYLTLDRCNLSMSQGDFFPTLCQMTQLKKLTIRGTYFQLHPTFPVEPTLDEISPLPDLQYVEMNYEKCSTKNMSNYFFPWKLFLKAMPNLGLLVFSYSNRTSLAFAIQQFCKMIDVVNQYKPGEINIKSFLRSIAFENIAEPNSKDPVIIKDDVMMMVSWALMKLGIPDTFVPEELIADQTASAQKSSPNVSFPKLDMIAELESFPLCLSFLNRGALEHYKVSYK